MKVLVTGAGGFIGSAVVEKLLAEGCYVIACARTHKNVPYTDRVEFQPVDLQQMLSREQWMPLLDGVDAVVNCAGILQGRSAELENIHYKMPRALAEACIELDVGKFIQISALGESHGNEFIKSKHQFDEYLLALPMEATVIRPSVVVSLRGSYGGTSLLRGLASVPFFLFLPGSGEQRIQPILLEDLATLVLRSFTRKQPANDVIYAVGPSVMTAKRYLSQLRHWLKYSPPMFIYVPMFLVSFAALIGQKFGRGPLGKTFLTMLEKGNVAPAGEYEKIVDYTGFESRSVEVALENSACFVQDRWHARLYLLKPVLWLSLIVLWLMSGIAGFLASPEEISTVLKGSPIASEDYQSLVYWFSGIDLLLAALLLLRIGVKWVLAFMFAMTLGYTVALTLWYPIVWMAPLGGLLKNIPLLVILPVYFVLEDMR